MKKRKEKVVIENVMMNRAHFRDAKMDADGALLLPYKKSYCGKNGIYTKVMVIVQSPEYL